MLILFLGKYLCNKPLYDDLSVIGEVPTHCRKGNRGKNWRQRQTVKKQDKRGGNK